MIANLGFGTLIITFIVSIYGVFAAIYGVRRNKPAWVDSSRSAMLLTFPLMTLTALSIIYLLVSGHYEVNYVATVTSSIGGILLSLVRSLPLLALSGFNAEEVGWENWQKLWLRGGFPRSYLAASDDDSAAWREGFIRTFLERDVPQLGISIPAPAMRRFWTMLSHYHGQIWNAARIAGA